MLPKHVRYQAALHSDGGPVFSSTRFIIHEPSSSVNPFFHFFELTAAPRFAMLYLVYISDIIDKKNEEHAMIDNMHMYSQLGVSESVYRFGEEVLASLRGRFDA